MQIRPCSDVVVCTFQARGPKKLMKNDWKLIINGRQTAYFTLDNAGVDDKAGKTLIQWEFHLRTLLKH